MKQLFAKYDKFIPYDDYNVNSPDEMLAVLEKQVEILERKGMTLTQNASIWMPKDVEVCINGIYQDRLTPYHNHDYYEINYVLEGQLVQYINGQKLVMNKGDFLIMSHSVRHSSFPVGEKCKCFNILLADSYVERTQKKMAIYDSTNYLQYVMNNNAYILFLNTGKAEIAKMIKEMASSPRGNNKLAVYSPLMARNIMEKILITLSACERYDQIFRDIPSNTEMQLRGERIVQYMNENYATITLDELAKKFGYSTQHIRRIIKKHTGMSYMTALQHKRIEVAMQLLRKSNLSVKEIAEIVGLDSPEYFSRRFKFERGVSPTEYRESQI